MNANKVSQQNYNLLYITAIDSKYTEHFSAYSFDSLEHLHKERNAKTYSTLGSSNVSPYAIDKQYLFFDLCLVVFHVCSGFHAQICEDYKSKDRHHSLALEASFNLGTEDSIAVL